MGVEEIKKIAKPILKKYGVKRAGLFGSAARGDFGPESDIDVIVEGPKGISLLDFVGIQLELEDHLGKKVDLVQYSAIKPRLRPYIMQDHIPIL